MLYFDELDELEESDQTKAGACAAEVDDSDRTTCAAELDDSDRATTVGSSSADVGTAISADGSTSDEILSPSALEKHSNPTSMTLQEARAVQGSLIREYTKSEFQDKLHAAHSEQIDPDKQSELTLDAQVRVAKKHGFEPSSMGAAMMCSALALYVGVDAEAEHKDAIIRWLLDPELQVSQPVPKGPARCTIFATARVFDSDGEHICRVEVHINDTIRCLKENIFLTTRRPWMTQKLYIKDAELFDQVILSSLMRVGATTHFRLEERQQEAVKWLERLKKGGMRALEGVPRALLSDLEFIVPAVQMKAQVLELAAPAVRADRRFVLELLPHCGQALRFVALELRADLELARVALQQDPWALELLAPELRANREIVLQAVRQDGWSLQFAAPELLWDKALVSAAVQKDPSIILKVLPELQKDRSVVIQAIQQDWQLLESIVPEMRVDREVVLAAVRQTGWALQHVPKERLGDREIVIEALRNNGDALRFVAPELYRDREVMLTAVRQSGAALGLVPPDVQDTEMAVAAVKQDKFALQFVAKHLLPDVRERLGPGMFAEGTPRAHEHEGSATDGQSRDHHGATGAGAALEEAFQTLGLPPTASKDEIRRRYHQLALQYHPDKCSCDVAVAKHMFQRVQQAYETLQDASRL